MSTWQEQISDPAGLRVDHGEGENAAWAAERASIDHLVQLDQWHRDRGHVMCGGVCSRWYEPDEVDDFGTCRNSECLRAAVNP